MAYIFSRYQVTTLITNTQKYPFDFSLTPDCAFYFFINYYTANMLSLLCFFLYKAF